MKRDRFWFGAAIVAVPLVLLCFCTLSPGIELSRSGPVEGHVSFRGQPLAGGSILFVPDDASRGNWAMAWIDENGHYKIGSVWSRKGLSGKTRYRICLMPDTHKTSVRGQNGAQIPSAWSGPGAVGFPAPDASSGFPAQLCDPKTTQFEVLLGMEPARIDLTF